MEVLRQVHEGLCGAHQAGIKMPWLIRRHGFFWPIILKDCIRYAKGCKQCPRFGSIQRIPPIDIHPIVKPWPFRGWAIDIIGKIYPTSFKNHGFLLVATDYFTKWANGQAETSNKVIISMLEKMMDDNSRVWHKILPEVLWAYRIKKRSSTNTSSFHLTYGHDAILPMEIVIPSLRVARQNSLTVEDYSEAMVMELEKVEEDRIQAFNRMLVQKKKISRAYNTWVKKKTFREGQLVWKAILPLGTKDREFSKWSPNWEGPFKVHKVLKGNSYWLCSLEGQPHRKFINSKYLREYFPTIWERNPSVQR
ncbi:uncharacterized protein LOC119980728 [Tripterygium wilfordii]|uniref:uncharacterized protein LOC119980728 n=1 Tax=Tripterygium wilfordii TaxID=458696 RepID=UPI0018F7F0FC|nr:uncharacterized protein LOC119980728 [Tripterygium wilfordii]